MARSAIVKVKVRILQSHEGSQAGPVSLILCEYTSAAPTHYGIYREEAEQLRMTAFILLLTAKNPDQKGFTREKYDSVKMTILRGR